MTPYLSGSITSSGYSTEFVYCASNGKGVESGSELPSFSKGSGCLGKAKTISKVIDSFGSEGVEEESVWVADIGSPDLSSR